MKIDSKDVIVIGAGNAGLCAAISASQNNKNVLVLEKSEYFQRGGNSALTMNFRFPHHDFKELESLIDDARWNKEDSDYMSSHYRSYTEEDFLKDLLYVSSGECDLSLAKTLSYNAASTIRWLHSLGHRWDYKDKSRQHASSLPIKIFGSGRELQKKSFKIAEKSGVEFSYKSRLISFEIKNMFINSILVDEGGVIKKYNANSVILALGGFQASREMRSKFLGVEWEDIQLRGVPYNTGDWYSMFIDNDLQLTGDYAHCHSTPQSNLLEEYLLPGDNEKSQNNSRYMFSVGITVNKCGKRFFDEGAEYPNFNYAQFGQAIQKQPSGLAYQIFDSVMVKSLPQNYFKKGDLFKSNSITSLANSLNIDHVSLLQTIEDFNQACSYGFSEYNPQLDGISTSGLNLPKSNWAYKINKPPFFIATVRAGLTFTYGGVKVDSSSRVINNKNAPIENLFACGEMVGGLHFNNYAGGTGLMFGSVMGKIAGQNA